MANLVFDFECCDCEGCHNDGFTPRGECGCDEDICPECGNCMLHCEGHSDYDDFDGSDENDTPM